MNAASYPPDVKVIRVKAGEKVAIQWEYTSHDGAQVPHVREVRISEDEAELIAVMDGLRRYFRGSDAPRNERE
jgi:hypothetical protein